MQYVLVHECVGRTLKERMTTLDFRYAPPEFLSQLACDTIETFLRGIFDTRMAIDDDQMNRELLDVSFARNSGTTVFRHPISSRTATFLFTCDVVLQARDPMRILVLSHVHSVQWTCDAHWDIIDRLACQIRLGIIESRRTTHDDKPHVCVPLVELKIDASTKELLKHHKCVFGKNVAYPQCKKGTTRTQRSMLVPESLIDVRPVVHEGLWIVAERSQFVDISADFLRFLGLVAIPMHNELLEVIEEYHTVADVRRIRTLLDELVKDPKGSSRSTSILFQVRETSARMTLVGHKVSSRLQFFTFHRGDTIDG